jgi:hypothetical protein
VNKVYKFVIAIVLIFALVACDTPSEEDQLRARAEFEDFMLSINYAYMFSLEFNAPFYVSSWDALRRTYPAYKKIIYVDQLPAELDEDTIYCYPIITSDPDDRDTKYQLDRLNRTIERYEIETNDYGLSYPITLSDLLSQHDKVKQLIDDQHNIPFFDMGQYTLPQ